MNSQKIRGHHQEYLCDGETHRVPKRDIVCIAQPTNIPEEISDYELYRSMFLLMMRGKTDFNFIVGPDGKIIMPAPPYMKKPVRVLHKGSESLVSGNSLTERTKARSVGVMNTFLLCSVMCLTRSKCDQKCFTGDHISQKQMMAIVQIYLFLKAGNPGININFALYSELTNKDYGSNIPRQEDLMAIKQMVTEAEGPPTPLRARGRPHYHPASLQQEN